MTPTPPPAPTFSSPPTMRVTVAVGYVRSCARCREIVAQLTSACIGDPTVQSCTAQPGREHACGAMAEPKAPRTALAAATAQPAYTGPALPFEQPEPRGLSPSEVAHYESFDLPISDTNGSDPEDVDDALFKTGPTTGESDPG